VDDFMGQDNTVHDFLSFHIANFLFGDDVRQYWFEEQGNDLSDDFVDNIAKFYQSKLLRMCYPFFLWNESEEGGIEG
jgi:hypothetical protein